MKILTMINVLICVVFLSTSLFAQHTPTSLFEKKENSTLIVEGQIIEQNSYFGDDGDVYTENIIRVKKTLKGDPISKLGIITMGGEIENTKYRWTNVLSLKIGQSGAFFLKPTKRPVQQTVRYKSFDVVSGVQGYYKYPTNLKEKVGTLFSEFSGIQSFYRALEIPYDRELVEIEKSKNCLNFSFELISQADLSTSKQNIRFNVFLNTDSVSLRLYRARLNINYSTEWFGDSISSKQKIHFELDSSFISRYTTSFMDTGSDSIMFAITNISPMYNLLTEIPTSKIKLGVLDIDLVKVGSDYPINMTNSNFYEATYLTMNNIEHPFDCSTVEITGRKCDMEFTRFEKGIMDPTEISKPIVAGGVGNESENHISGIVTIKGKNFWADFVDTDNDGEPDVGFDCGIVPPGHKIWFTKIASPNNPNDDDKLWISPPEGDYLLYSDEKIVVKVPTLGYLLDGTFSDEQYDKPCSGVIRICRPIGEDPCGCEVFTSEIEIKFNADNETYTNENGCIASAKIKLPNLQDGGQRINYYFPVQGDVNQKKEKKINLAFLNALETWRCNTFVNWSANNGPSLPSSARVSINYNLPTTTGAATSYVIPVCQEDPSMFQVRSWKIGINKNKLSFKKEIESLFLHELGHAHLLNHVCEISKTMYPLNNHTDITLSDDDILGGIHISVLSSTDGASCETPNMILLNIDNCKLNIPNSLLELNITNLEIIKENPIDNYMNLELNLVKQYQIKYVSLIDNYGFEILSNISTKEPLIFVGNISPGFYIALFKNKEGQILKYQKLIKT